MTAKRAKLVQPRVADPSKPPSTDRTLVLPLPADQRAAYEDLYAKYETEIEGNEDGDVLVVLNSSQRDVQTVLDQDDTYKIQQTTQLLADLTEQIRSTNDQLVKVKGEIQAMSDKINTAAAILGAIGKVLTLVPH